MSSFKIITPNPKQIFEKIKQKFPEWKFEILERSIDIREDNEDFQSLIKKITQISRMQNVERIYYTSFWAPAEDHQLFKVKCIIYGFEKFMGVTLQPPKADGWLTYEINGKKLIAREWEIPAKNCTNMTTVPIILEGHENAGCRGYYYMKCEGKKVIFAGHLPQILLFKGTGKDLEEALHSLNQDFNKAGLNISNTKEIPQIIATRKHNRHRRALFIRYSGKCKNCGYLADARLNRTYRIGETRTYPYYCDECQKFKNITIQVGKLVRKPKCECGKEMRKNATPTFKTASIAKNYNTGRKEIQISNEKEGPPYICPKCKKLTLQWEINAAVE